LVWGIFYQCRGNKTGRLNAPPVDPPGAPPVDTPPGAFSRRIYFPRGGYTAKMESIFDEIEREAVAYFQKEEQDKYEKARVDKIWLMRKYNRLKTAVSDMNRLKDKEKASAARKALKLFRLENNM
jgi:hypothetical protein